MDRRDDDGSRRPKVAKDEQKGIGMIEEARDRWIKGNTKATYY